jgi:hypothetical protein
LQKIAPASGLLGVNVYKSADSGSTWIAATGLTPQDQNALVIDRSNPSTIYAATGGGYFDHNGGVFKSIDGGVTWVAANNGLPPKAGGALAIDPSNPSIVYVGTSGYGLFKSIDGGASWQALAFQR